MVTLKTQDLKTCLHSMKKKLIEVKETHNKRICDAAYLHACNHASFIARKVLPTLTAQACAHKPL